MADAVLGASGVARRERAGVSTGLRPPRGERYFRAAARHHDRRGLPGAVRASAGISTTDGDIERLLDAAGIVATTTPPIEYLADPVTGDYWPHGHARPDAALGPATGCARG